MKMLPSKSSIKNGTLERLVDLDVFLKEEYCSCISTIRGVSTSARSASVCLLAELLFVSIISHLTLI